MRLQTRTPDGTLAPAVALAPSSTTDVGGPAQLRQTSQGTLVVWLVDDATDRNGFESALVGSDGNVLRETLANPRGASGSATIALGADGRALILRTDPGGVVRAWVRDAAWPTEPNSRPPITPAGPSLDRDPPVLRAVTKNRVSSRSRRISLAITPSEPCLITIRAVVDPAGRAKRAGLKTVFARAGAARTPVHVRLELPAALRAKLRRGGLARVTFTAVDAARNRRTMHLTVTIRRR